MKRILITFGTEPLAQRIGKLLADQYTLLYASSQPFPEILLKQNYRKLPTSSNPTYVHEALKLALDEAVDFILPLGKGELQALQEARILFEEYGISLLMPARLDDVLIVEKPEKHFDIQVIAEGKDLLNGTTVSEPSFSGAAIVSDSGEDIVLCVV